MATNQANATHVAESENVAQATSVKPFVVDAKVVDISVARNADGSVKDRLVRITFDQEFETIDTRTGQTVKTDHFTKDPYAITRHLEKTPLYMAFRADANAASRNAIARGENQVYDVNPALILFLLKGAEVKFSKTFKEKGGARMNGEMYENDILQADILAVHHPLFDKGDDDSVDAVLDAFEKYAARIKRRTGEEIDTHTAVKSEVRVASSVNSKEAMAAKLLADLNEQG